MTKIFPLMTFCVLQTQSPLFFTHPVDLQQYFFAPTIFWLAPTIFQHANTQNIVRARKNFAGAKQYCQAKIKYCQNIIFFTLNQKIIFLSVLEIRIRIRFQDPRSAYFYRDPDPQKIRNNFNTDPGSRILNIPSKYELKLSLY